MVLSFKRKDSIRALSAYVDFTIFPSSRPWKKSIKGDAIYQEESVPKMTPIVITKAKLKIEGPPKITRASNTRSVVPDVIVVRLNVAFSEWLTIL